MKNLILIKIVFTEKINMKMLFLLVTLIISSIQIHPYALKNYTLKNKEEILAKICKEPYFPYQDIIINNTLIGKGIGPDCPFRYEAIKTIISKYNRPIKILDLGANNGYFSLRIAHDFQALCVMIDVSDRLCEICKLNNEISNVIYLKKQLSLEDLKLLNKNEHFDVVLALNIIHHMQPWEEILNTIFELGDTVIIETPPANDTRAQKECNIPLIESFLLKKSNGKIIAQIPRADSNNFGQIEAKKFIKENDILLNEKKCIPNVYAKMFCFENVINNLKKISLNLTTFNLLNGVYPEFKNSKEDSYFLNTSSLMSFGYESKQQIDVH